MEIEKFFNGLIKGFIDREICKSGCHTLLKIKRDRTVVNITSSEKQRNEQTRLKSVK